MFKRLFSLICFLFICLVPVNLFALKDSYVIKSNNDIRLSPLYSRYIWKKSTWVISGTKTPSGYYCDGSTTQYWTYYNPETRSTGCDDKQKIGLSTCGYWSITRPSYPTSTKQSIPTRTLCSESGSNKAAVKDLIQNAYKTDNDSDAFCVNPGRAFSEQTYVKSEEYNISDCKTSNNSYYCALASVFANYSSADYLAKLTALRLIAGAYNQGGGWWDSGDGGVTYPANIYANTAKEIMSGTFDIKIGATKDGILYDKGESNGSFQSGVDIFKAVMNGFEIWTPSAKVVSKSYDGSQVTLNIETNFDGISTISNVTYNGYNVNYSAAECSNSSSKTCMTVTFNLNFKQASNCKNKIRIFYEKIDSKAISSVYLYTASQNVGNQQMVVYDTNDETYVDVSICPSGGEDLKCKKVKQNNGTYIYYGPNGTVVDETTYNRECKNTCDETNIDYKMPENCNEGTSGAISDPSMCTIMNSKSSVKDSYYKKEYGNNYCDVYCRESLNFTFMDKETAIAGRYFYHNVQSYKTTKGFFSTIILSTRQCTSIIYYDNWKIAYDVANGNVLDTWNRWKKIEAQVKSTKSSESTKNCDGGSKSACEHDHKDDILIKDSNGIEIGRDHSVKKLPGTYCNPTTITCTSYDWSDAKYDHTYSGGDTSTINVGGSDTCPLSCGITCSGCNNSVGIATPPAYNGEEGEYKNAKTTRDNLIDQIKSCNFVEDFAAYKGVMKYDPNNTIGINYEELYKFKEEWNIEIGKVNTENEVVSRTYSDSSDWSSFCSKDCNGDLSNLSRSSNDTTLDYWNCGGTGYDKTCKNIKVPVPQNRLANIEVQREDDYYQSNEFYVQAYTGKIATKAGETGYWFELAENKNHLYPVSSVRETGTYDIEVTYSNLGDRKNSTIKMADGQYSCSYDVINELTIYDCNDNYDDHTCKCLDGTDCSKNVDGQLGMGVYYRTISLNDVFPHSSYSPTVGGTINVNTRNIGKNWTTTKAAQVVKEIQSIGDNLIVDKKPQYVIKLTPSIMKQIRKHNDKTTYLDNSIYKCDNNSICYSSFLDTKLNEFRGNSIYSKDSSIKSDSLFYYNRDNYIKK